MNHRKHKDIALARRVEAERQVAQTPMLGWKTSGGQLAYLESLGPQKPKPPLGKPPAWLVEPAATITPEQLRAAFVNAGVTNVEGRHDNDDWHDEGMDWGFTLSPHQYRPAPGTPPEVLTAFYRQWDIVEFRYDRTHWAPEQSKRGAFHFWPAEYWRLPASAKLVRPLPAKE